MQAMKQASYTLWLCTLALFIAVLPQVVSATTAFEPVARAVTHPRCMNCYQAEVPRQTDKGMPCP